MTLSLQAFMQVCTRPNVDCVDAVREVIGDERMRAALEHDPTAWPIDLILEAQRRADDFGIPQIWPERDQAAVGFMQFRQGNACALHIPGAGWWAKGRTGAAPIHAKWIATAYEVRTWPPLS